MGVHAQSLLRQPIFRVENNYTWQQHGNPKPQQQMSTFSLRKRIPGTASCAWQHSQIFPLDRLSRYEYMLWQQARQIVFTLDFNAAPPAKAKPLKLSIFVPATRARRLVRRVQVTAELSALRTASGSRAITVR